MDELLKKIEELVGRVDKTWDLLRIDDVKEELSELKEKMSEPGFWDDQVEAVKISKQCEDDEKFVAMWANLKNELTDLIDFLKMLAEEGDDVDLTEYGIKFRSLEEKFKQQEFYVLFASKYDRHNAIISIHAGTGGVDAQDWAEILERMFLRFCEKQEFKANILEKTYGNEAGIKSVTIEVIGKWSYGYLQSESGVHRLVRISPFDAEAMRHTSFALVEVIPELPDAEEVEISDSDLKIDVYKSSGPGGQGVNTTDSAVRITHLPSKIVVSCQNERSQHQNKETAIKILKSKLYKIEQEKKDREEAKLRGEAQKAEWGNQIRSYVMQPYQMVKDHRTKCETQEINRVLDGDLQEFIEAFLKWKINN